MTRVDLLSASWLVGGPGLVRFLRSKSLYGAAAIVLLAPTLALVVASETDEPPAEIFQIMQAVVLGGVVVPLVALLFGTAAIASERESGTLPYLFTRPFARAAVVLGKGTVALGLSIAAVVATTILVWLATGAPAGAEVGGGLLALVLETTALASVFVLFGTLTARGLFSGLAYVALFEGVLGSVAPNNVYSLTWHGRNMLSEWSGGATTAFFAEMPASAATSALVTVAVAAASLALAALWVERREYGLRDRPKED